MIQERISRFLMAAAAVCILVAVALNFLARTISAEQCGVASTNTDESIDCNSSMDITISRSAAAPRVQVPVVRGLSYTFYDKSCPSYRAIIRRVVTQRLRANPLVAAGILRIMFHDCFVQGCDASILVTDSGDTEQSSGPNLSLRPESLQLVNDIKSQLEFWCPKTVSCADIISLGSAEAIRQSKGPSIRVPVGRRDSISVASSADISTRLPSPTENVSQILPHFTSLGFNLVDMVALTGAHTLGQAHCSSFSNRLHPNVDIKLNVNIANNLAQLCPTDNTTNFHSLDSTPNVFDNNYFKELRLGDALLTSDASLGLDTSTRSLVKQYALSGNKFKEQFGRSFLKLSQINVLTGRAGNIRKKCTAMN